MANPGEISYIGKISLDASELMRVLGMGGGAGGGVGGGGEGGPTTASDLKTQDNIRKGTTKAHKDPGFMSIFRPLAALEGMKSLVSNSRVANAYLGGMGKMFSAAIDLLLLPFTPLFNIMMVAMSKLVAWLIDSGVLEWMAQGVDDLVGLFQGAWNTLKDIWDAVKGVGKAIWEALPEPIRKGLEAAGKVAGDVLGPLGQLAKRAGGVVAAGAGMAVGGQMLMSMMGIGSLGPLAMAGRGMGKLFGRGGGGGGGPGNLPFGGLPGAGGGRGFRMGGMGRMLGGGALMAGGMGLGMVGGQQGGAVGTASRIGGMGMMGAGAGFMLGGPAGAAVGGLAGLGVGALDQGLLGGRIGKFMGMGGGGGGGGGRGGGGGPVKNIGTQNITMNVYVQDKEMAKEIIQNIDEEMTASSMAGGGV